MYFQAHDLYGVLAHDTGSGELSRPFDRRRNGFVLGAGAFALVVETVASATRRGVSRLGTIAAVTATSGPCKLNDWPHNPAPLARCMDTALRQAGATPADVAVVLASANSSVALDQTEAAALVEVFGPRGVPVTSVKGALGECGAVGAAGVVVASAALRDGVIPPTVGFSEAEPGSSIDVVAEARSIGRSINRVALVNSFASGGALFSAVIGL
jgi:3-oxoacyl-[acyl-carrier-protein] synthase II